MDHRLIVVFGLPGSGKTTITRKIRDALGHHACQVLRTDEIRKELFPQPIYSKAEADETFWEMYARAEKYLKQWKTVILDGVFAKQQERDATKEIAKKHNVPYQLLQIFADERTTQVRLSRQPLEEWEADFEVYLKLKRWFDPIKEDVRKIDNSKDIELLDRWVEIILR